MTQVWPGTAYPLGATYDGSGTWASRCSVRLADKVELCLFDPEIRELGRPRVTFPEMDGSSGTPSFPGSSPASATAYRVHGPYDPAHGQRCNPNKLVLLTRRPRPWKWRTVKWNPPLLAGTAKSRLAATTRTSACQHARSSSDQPVFRLGTLDHPPGREYYDSVIYEAHVKGLDPDPPGRPRGVARTYAAIAHPVVIELSAGVEITAIELMPVHQFVDDTTLVEKGSSNYWGYNTIGFFAPHNEYASNPRQAGPGVQGHGARTARYGHRGHPRRRLQPHR